jgi:hypothetical protein
MIGRGKLNNQKEKLKSSGGRASCFKLFVYIYLFVYS